MNSDNLKKTAAAWAILLFIIVLGLSFQHNSVTGADNSSNLSVSNSSNVSVVSASAVPSILYAYANQTTTIVNETFEVYANYTYENGTIVGTCLLEAQQMIYHSGFYTWTYSLDTAGNHTLDVNCTSPGYENKSAIIDIEILPIFSNITPAIDDDNDGYNATVDCDDNDPEVNPGHDEVLYNNIDDDCNPATKDYVVFNIKTDKSSYAPQQTVRITVNATNHSDTYLTINSPTNVSYVYIFSNGTYPVVQEFSLTGLSGQYSIDATNYYGNYTNTDYKEFTIDDNFNIAIDASDDTAYVGEPIDFKSVITGSVGNVNMIWKMDDNKERYDDEFTYNYSSPREYNVVLIATDTAGNQDTATKKITVLPKYYLKVNVKENGTNDILGNAEVKLNSNTKEVNTSGSSEFTVANKTYDLKVSAPGYYTYDTEIKINSSFNLNVLLNKNKGTVPPTVILVSPANNSQTSSQEFKFKFQDDSKADCTLYLSEGDGWWSDYNESANLSSGTDYSFRQDLAAKSYQWKVLCTDTDGNVGYSPSYNVTIKDSLAAAINEETPDTTYNVVQNVYDLIPDFNTYGPDEKKIVDYLDMNTVLKDAKRKLEMANKDIFNLKNEPDTASMIDKRDEIYARIDDIKDQTPLSVSVVDKAEFVKYVDDASVSDLIDEYISLKNLDLSNGEIKKLKEQNTLLQKKITLQTTAYLVKVQYISGRTETMTLVSRDIVFDSDASNVKYIEFIPKDLVQDAKDITFVDQPDKILNSDPVIEYNLKDLAQVVYYINGQNLLDAIPKIKPLVINTDIDSSASGVTGLAILDNIGLSDSNKKVFIGEVLVIFILLGVYLYFYYRSSSSSKVVSAPSIKPIQKAITVPEVKPTAQVTATEGASITDPHKTNYNNILIEKANMALKSNDLKDAALKYHEIKFLYDLLDEPNQKHLYTPVMKLSDDIAYNHILLLVDEAIIELAKGNHHLAQELYEHVQDEFSKLSEDYKTKVYPRCCELSLHLNKNVN